MRAAQLVSVLVLAVAAPSVSAQLSYKLDYSTYLGGSYWEHARDVFTDSSGFTYVVGGSGSPDFTGTSLYPGAPATNLYNDGQTQTYNNGVLDQTTNPADGRFGPCDVFITKMDQAGQVLWTKYMGGVNYDRAYAIEVSTVGDIYISGRAGIGFETTAGLQTTFQGTTSGSSNYGSQNAFVAKLNSAGTVQWSTYLGTGELARDVAIDNNGGVYVPLTLATNSSRTLDAGYFGGGKIKNSAPTPNTNDSGIAKIDAATGQVIWARWIGGSGSETTNPSVRVNSAGEAFMLIDTGSTSSSLAAVGAVSQTNSGGSQDVYIAKFKADGTGLQYGTYLGGSGSEGHETHSLALDQNGNAVIAIHSDSTDYPVTAGALNIAGTGSNLVVTRLDNNGARVVSARIGATGNANPDGVYVDKQGRVYIAGETNAADFQVTAGAYQSTKRGSNDGFFMVLSADLSTILYSTYMGGTLYDNGRTLFIDENTGTVYIAGGTLSTDLPVLNAFDSSFSGGSHPFAPGSGDAWLAKFSVVPEPAGFALGVLGASALLRRSRRRH